MADIQKYGMKKERKRKGGWREGWKEERMQESGKQGYIKDSETSDML